MQFIHTKIRITKQLLVQSFQTIFNQYPLCGLGDRTDTQM